MDAFAASNAQRNKLFNEFLRDQRREPSSNSPGMELRWSMKIYHYFFYPVLDSIKINNSITFRDGT